VASAWHVTDPQTIVPLHARLQSFLLHVQVLFSNHRSLDLACANFCNLLICVKLENTVLDIAIMMLYLSKIGPLCAAAGVFLYLRVSKMLTLNHMDWVSDIARN
jgi:hypothetical protein